MNPTFSIVVPTRNRPIAIVRCLKALARQNYSPSAFEVIVVDDDSSASLESLEREFAGQFALRVLRQTQTGPATARNRGARLATGVFLAFTDDDCQPSPDWLSNLERSLTAHPSALIGGQVVNGIAGNNCSTASQELIDYLYRAYTDHGMPRFFTSNNLCISKADFEKVGGFDETFPLAAAEDRDFCARWSRSGGAMVYAAGAVVQHFHDLSLRRFIRQHFCYGRGAHQFWRHVAGYGGAAPRLEPLSFYWNLLSFPFQREQPRALLRATVLSSLLLVSQAANVAGFLYQAVSSLGAKSKAVDSVAWTSRSS